MVQTPGLGCCFEKHKNFFPAGFKVACFDVQVSGTKQDCSATNADGHVAFVSTGVEWPQTCMRHLGDISAQRD